MGKKGFTENFRGISLYHKKIGVDCSSSLPYRQLRNQSLAAVFSSDRSLPYRQLRKSHGVSDASTTSSLPYRQLRKEAERLISCMFTAVQAA